MNGLNRQQKRVLKQIAALEKVIETKWYAGERQEARKADRKLFRLQAQLKHYQRLG